MDAFHPDHLPIEVTLQIFARALIPNETELHATRRVWESGYSGRMPMLALVILSKAMVADRIRSTFVKMFQGTKKHPTPPLVKQILLSPELRRVLYVEWLKQPIEGLTGDVDYTLRMDHLAATRVQIPPAWTREKLKIYRTNPMLGKVLSEDEKNPIAMKHVVPSETTLFEQDKIGQWRLLPPDWITEYAQTVAMNAVLRAYELSMCRYFMLIMSDYKWMLDTRVLHTLAMKSEPAEGETMLSRIPALEVAYRELLDLQLEHPNYRFRSFHMNFIPRAGGVLKNLEQRHQTVGGKVLGILDRAGVYTYEDVARQWGRGEAIFPLGDIFRRVNRLANMKASTKFSILRHRNVPGTEGGMDIIRKATFIGRPFSGGHIWNWVPYGGAPTAIRIEYPLTLKRKSLGVPHLDTSFILDSPVRVFTDEESEQLSRVHGVTMDAETPGLYIFVVNEEVEEGLLRAKIPGGVGL